MQIVSEQLARVSPMSCPGLDPAPINGLEVPLFVQLHGTNIVWHAKHNYLIAAMNTELKCHKYLPNQYNIIT